MYYHYSKDAIDYLAKKDKKLKLVIERIGMIKRQVNPDLYESIIFHIIGQQISTKAHKTVFDRLVYMVDNINPNSIISLTDQQLQSIGISFRKVTYIKGFTQTIINDPTILTRLKDLDDEQVIKELIKIKGVGKWTVEMLMIFCLQRPDILSYDDLAILRGMRLLYGHKKISKSLFERYRKRYSPYGSVASLYLWAVAQNKIPDLFD